MKILTLYNKILNNNNTTLTYFPNIINKNVLQIIIDNKKSAYSLFSNFNVSNLDNYLVNLDFSNVDNTSYMFLGCNNLKEIPQLNTSNVTNMNSMFFSCSKLETIPQLNTNNVTDMSNMFNYCLNLKEIPSLDTSNVTNMHGMFDYCNNLKEIPQLDTSNVTNMARMFERCTKLQTIPELNTSNVTDMGNMFNSCTNLQTIPLLDTSNVAYMNDMFRDCTKLQTIDLTSMDKITTTMGVSYMCAYCFSLTKLIIRTMTVIPILNSNAFDYCYRFNGTVDATYNPNGLKDGRIYVPDNMVEQLKQAEGWNQYADIIVGLSELPLEVKIENNILSFESGAKVIDDVLQLNGGTVENDILII